MPSPGELPPASRTPSLRGGPRTLAVFLAAAVAYALLGQDALYRFDAFLVLASLDAHTAQRSCHELFLPLLLLFDRILAPLALPPHRVAALFSAIGTAAGVACTWRAFRLLCATPQQALRAAALVAVAPPVVFFATVVEYHGAFFAFAQLALLATVVLLRRPSAARAAALGAATALATLVHASGVLLPLLFVPWFLATAPVAPRRRAALGLLAFTVHAVLVVAGTVILRALLATPPLPFRTELGPLLAAVAHAPGAFLREWLVPYAPLTLGALCAVRQRSAWPLLAVLGVALCAYAVASGIVLGTVREWGAYFLPLSAPAALLAVRALPAPAAWVLALVSCAGAIVAVRVHDRAASTYPTFLDGVAAAAHPRAPLPIVLAQHERAALAVLRPGWRAIDLDGLVAGDERVLFALAEELPGWIAKVVRPTAECALVSDASLAALAAAHDGGRALAAALRVAGTRVDRGGFAGFEVPGGALPAPK